jgi:hypothetical protein
MTQIQPFNAEDPEILSNVDYIKMKAPVRNLTDQEIMITLRLLQLQVLLRTLNRNNWARDVVVVHMNDPRLEQLDDTDKFLAMLIDCDLRDVLLTSKRCIRLFGGIKYHWRKIGRTMPITDTASAISECSSGYYGRGWVIAPNICTLRRWIIEHSDNEQIKSLKV